MDMQSSIVPVQHSENQIIAEVKGLYNLMVRMFKDEVLVEGRDYGVIPGTGDKKTLYLSGMEKVMRVLNAVPDYIERHIIRDYDRNIFHYEYECRLIDATTGMAIPGGRGLGMCTSMESSFRWRKAERRCPTCGKSAIIKGSEEYGGGWVCWKKKEGCGAKFKDGDRSIEGQEAGRIENPDICDQINAILKRAKKRALGDAVKGAAAISDLVTVDLEDMERFGDFEEGVFEEVKDAPPAQPKVIKDDGTPSANGHTQAEPPPSTGNGSSSSNGKSGQPEQDEGDSVQPWPNDKDVRYVVNYVKEKLHITDKDILRYLDMDDLTVLDNWKQFDNGGAAMKAIKAAMDAETEALKNAPPAQPKNNPFSQSGNGAPLRHQWTANDVAAMDGFCATFWDTEFQAPLLPDKVLASGEYIGWSTFQGGLPAARAALIQYAKEERLPIIVGEATFAMLPNKSSRTTFTNGLLEVVEYGRDRLRGLGADWKAYVNEWSTAGGKYVFDRAGLPHLIVSWKLKQAESDRHEYLNCDGLKTLEITETVPF